MGVVGERQSEENDAKELRGVPSHNIPDYSFVCVGGTRNVKGVYFAVW